VRSDTGVRASEFVGGTRCGRPVKRVNFGVGVCSGQQKTIQDGKRLVQLEIGVSMLWSACLGHGWARE
jgi:hypothetical protein